MNDLTVTVYGGAAVPEGEIGGNRILVEWDDARWFCDFGSRFGASARFYEEYLKPRDATVGLRDHLRMGLLPPLEGLYRDDLYAHEPDMWERYRGRPLHRRLEQVDGVLLSHAHLDHNGSLGFVRTDVPVYTGLTSAVIAKAMQDTRGGSPDGELCYMAPKEATDEGIIRNVKGAPRVQRRHVVCEDIPITEALRAFWRAPPGPRTRLDSRPLETWDRDDLRFWRLDHSIPGSGAFGIRTPAGWVLYSGDVRRHGHSSWRVDAFVREAAALKPVLLIVEGTRVTATESVTEPEVHQAADEAVVGTDGLVIADFGPRNIERLRTFHDIAHERGRRLVVTAQDAYMLENLHLVDPAIPMPDPERVCVLRKPEGKIDTWKKDLYDRHAACVVEAGDVHRDPGGFVLCFSYWDLSNLVDIDPPGGTYIYSSSEAYTEEQVFDQERLMNWLDYFGFGRVGGLPRAKLGPFHASGHADGPALETLISDIDAERILPVHTEALDWFQQRWPDRVITAPYGEPVRIE